jgi:hypothetical protein
MCPPIYIPFVFFTKACSSYAHEGRDPDYLKLQLNFAMDVSRGRKIINMFPPILKPFAGRWLTTVPQRVDECINMIEGFINERKAKMDEYGVNFPDKPVRSPPG